MLGKLLKYDLKSLFKAIIPLYLFVVLSAVFTIIAYKLGWNFTIFQILKFTFSTLFVISILVVLIFSFFIGVRRFYQNMLKDEGYLTNTLPIKKSSLIFSKLLASIIVMICSTIICLLAIILIELRSFDISQLNSEVVPGINGYGLAALIIIVAITQMMAYLSSFYNALSLGHKHSNNKMIFSIIYGIVIYVAIQVISSIGLIIFLNLANYGSLVTMEFSTSNSNISTLMLQMFGFAVIANIIYTTINFIMTKITLKNNLNLE